MQNTVTIPRNNLTESQIHSVEYHNQHHAMYKIKRTETIYDVYCDCNNDFSVEVPMNKAVNVKCGNCNSTTLIHNNSK